MRVTKRRAETRARLLDAAFRVFAAKGFGPARIDDVCEAAGYTRGAFYSNFGTLDELFFALYDERAAIIASQVADALTAEPPAPIEPSIHAVIARTAATLLLDRDWLLVKTDSCCTPRGTPRWRPAWPRTAPTCAPRSSPGCAPCRAASPCPPGWPTCRPRPTRWSPPTTG